MTTGRGLAVLFPAGAAGLSILAPKVARTRGEKAPDYRSARFTASFWRACGLALLLLFVQHLAQTHALEHMAADSLVAAAGDDVSGCPQCLALGGLHGGAMATAGGNLPPTASDGPLVFMPAAESPRRPISAHAIRAPPENRD